MREQILDAAFEILHESGVKKLTQPKVAQKVGIRQSHLTYYFPLKIDLLTALVERFEAKAAEAIHSLPDREDPKAVIEALRQQIADPKHIRVFLGLVIEAGQNAELETMLTKHVTAFNQQVADKLGRTSEDPDVSVLLAVLRGMGLQRLLLGDEVEGINTDHIVTRLGFSASAVSEDV